MLHSERMGAIRGDISKIFLKKATFRAFKLVADLVYAKGRDEKSKGHSRKRGQHVQRL